MADVVDSSGRLFSFFSHAKQTSATLLATSTGVKGYCPPLRKTKSLPS